MGYLAVEVKLEHFLSAYIQRYRNYRAYNVQLGIVEKVWNNGRGSLDLFRVYLKERKIVVNMAVYNKSDAPKLSHLIAELERLYPKTFHKWELVFTTLDYPAYYHNSLSLEWAKFRPYVRGVKKGGR